MSSVWLCLVFVLCLVMTTVWVAFPLRLLPCELGCHWGYGHRLAGIHLLIGWPSLGTSCYGGDGILSSFSGREWACLCPPLSVSGVAIGAACLLSLVPAACLDHLFSLVGLHLYLLLPWEPGRFSYPHCPDHRLRLGVQSCGCSQVSLVAACRPCIVRCLSPTCGMLYRLLVFWAAEGHGLCFQLHLGGAVVDVAQWA